MPPAVELHDGRPRAMGFSGAFVGLWAWDLTGAGHPASFSATAYRPA